MKFHSAATAIWAVAALLVAHTAADAGCAAAVSCLHPAPAPLLAAGIPAFIALGGGLTARQLWRKFGRRS